jgi:hypothetical protein
LRRRVHGGQEWEAMQREIKKNMYQAASFTGDFGEATNSAKPGFGAVAV